MQAVLSFDQAPPFAAPFRFFLTAPLFPLLAGLLLLIEGPPALASRWTPAMLALTHLIAVGFMLQAMLGAMIQILPVVAGANLPRPLLVARALHLLLVTGALALAAGFLGLFASAFPLTAVLLGTGVGGFALIAAFSLRGIPATSASIRSFRLALVGLCGLLVLGIMLAGGLSGLWRVPLIDLTRVHVNWALAGWGLALLSAVAYVVVPMFQITPAYPARFTRAFGPALLIAVLLASLAPLAADDVAELLQMPVIVLAAIFCGTTLWLQARSKRARPDATQKFWRLAMLAGLAAALLWAVARIVPPLAAWDGWPLLFGILVLVGGFMSVIIGMLYKIIPFLIWLHLQNRGKGRVIAPNMKAVLAESRMLRHLRLHLGACALLLAAVVWPAGLAHLAGLALMVASGYLFANLLAAARLYRQHAARVDAVLAEAVHAVAKEGA